MALSLAYTHGITVIPFNALHYPSSPTPRNSQMKTQWGVRVRGLSSEAMMSKEAVLGHKMTPTETNEMTPKDWLAFPHFRPRACADWNGKQGGVAQQYSPIHVSFQSEFHTVVIIKNGSTNTLICLWLYMRSSAARHASPPFSSPCGSNPARLSIYWHDLTLMSSVLK